MNNDKNGRSATLQPSFLYHCLNNRPVAEFVNSVAFVNVVKKSAEKKDQAICILALMNSTNLSSGTGFEK